MIASACFGLLGLTLCGSDPGEGMSAGLQRYEFAETHMGSEFKIVLYSIDEATARRASRSAFDRITALDASFSDYQPDSELMRLCDRAGGPPVRVSDDLLDILQKSKAMYEKSAGTFDVTVGPIVRLWRRARRDRKMPAPELLAKARALVSSDRMVIDPKAKTVQLLLPGMKLDLGGIAKGYASDAAIAVLRRQGIDRALVAGAGDIVVSGPPPGRTGWVIGIAPLEHPEARPLIFLSLHDVGISTAGDTERYVVIDGRRYSHIVDPHTGLGIVDRATVTVVAPDGTTADALDTTVYALGPERGLPLVEATPGAAALVVRATDQGERRYESERFRLQPRVDPSQASEPAARLRPR